MGWGQHDVIGGRAQDIDGRGVDLADQLLACLLFGLPSFGQHHEPLGFAHGIGAAEHRHAAFADAGNVADRLLQIVGIDIASAADNDVLDATGDVDLAARDVSEVARVQPVVVEQLARLLRVPEVAAGGGRALEFETALYSITEFPAGTVDDADLVSWQRPAAGNHAQRRHIARRGWHSVAGTHEWLARNHVDQRSAVQWRKGEPHRAFRQPVHGHDRLSAQAVRRKAAGEGLEGACADRLGAVEGDPPAGQVQALDLLSLQLAMAQVVGKVRGRGERGTMAVYGPQPAVWARQEGQRGHQSERHAVVQGCPAMLRSDPCRDRAAANSRIHPRRLPAAPLPWRGYWPAGWRESAPLLSGCRCCPRCTGGRLGRTPCACCLEVRRHE